MAAKNTQQMIHHTILRMAGKNTANDIPFHTSTLLLPPPRDPETTVPPNSVQFQIELKNTSHSSPMS